MEHYIAVFFGALVGNIIGEFLWRKFGKEENDEHNL